MTHDIGISTGLYQMLRDRNPPYVVLPLPPWPLVAGDLVRLLEWTPRGDTGRVWCRRVTGVHAELGGDGGKIVVGLGAMEEVQHA